MEKESRRLAKKLVNRVCEVPISRWVVEDIVGGFPGQSIYRYSTTINQESGLKARLSPNELKLSAPGLPTVMQEYTIEFGLCYTPWFRFRKLGVLYREIDGIRQSKDDKQSDEYHHNALCALLKRG